MFKSLEFLVGQKVNIDQVIQTLVAFGYTRATKVFREGEFALRGGVLDIYPANFEIPLRLDLDDDTVLAIHGFDPVSAENIDEHSIVLVLPFKTSSKSVFSSDVPLNNFVDIEHGDYVVHNHHGIGRFVGNRPYSFDGVGRDQSAKGIEYLVIEYKGGDKLFVPKHDIHLVQKYVSFTKRPARMHKLGSKEWLATRRAVEKKLRLLAAELLRTQALRAQLPGYAFSKDNEWQKEFEAKFPFKETPDQFKSTIDTKADMESSRPMDRLICGDVGYGKTEVAMRAAFKAVMDNKQVAILVPTTILAEQHYYNFNKRLEGFPVKVGMLSRFRTRHEQKMIVKETSEGKVDIVIGTHRLLSKDVAFKDLGLVIIDEEQRFGVKSKEKLKHFRLLADVMTLTATPIPRTLYMALSGARDMSVISTPPTNRLAVKTQIIGYDEKIIQEAIERELARHGQVFFLHNRVDNIDTIAKNIKKLAPKAIVAVGHGQMSGRLLEEIMLKFLKHEIDILVCTTIIESGIDVPLANTLIVNRADKFGLADLHQLRGRVGRLDVQAYAYFIVQKRELQSEITRQRLKAIEKHSDLGAGFHIAFEDLQIRGAGNLLGAQQHGFITSIGFDLYCRLLKESIEHLKKEVEINMNRILQNISFLAIGLLLSAPLAPAAPASTDAIIAIVNDDVITLKDLRQYISSIASQLRVENKSSEEIQQIMQDYEQKGLDKLIEDKLILAAANDKGIQLRDDLVDKRMKEIKDRYASEEDFINALNAQGMTVSDLQQKLTDQLKVKYEVDMEVRDKLFVNPQDVTDYYNTHTAEFNRKPMVNLQSVFVSYDKYSKPAARTRADEARSRMMAGEDFDKIFQKYSDSSSVGEVEQGQMVDVVENVVFNLKLDQVSDPVEVENGIYVFKAIGISPGKQQALEEVKDQIYNKLLDDQFQAKFKVWVDKLRDKAYVDIK